MSPGLSWSLPQTESSRRGGRWWECLIRRKVAAGHQEPSTFHRFRGKLDVTGQKRGISLRQSVSQGGYIGCRRNFRNSLSPPSSWGLRQLKQQERHRALCYTNGRKASNVPIRRRADWEKLNCLPFQIGFFTEAGYSRGGALQNFSFRTHLTGRIGTMQFLVHFSDTLIHVGTLAE